MIKIKGIVKFVNARDMYALEVRSGEYVIIESTDELAGDDVISWDDNWKFYNHTQNCEISAMLQWDEAGYQTTIKRLQSVR